MFQVSSVHPLISSDVHSCPSCRRWNREAGPQAETHFESSYLHYFLPPVRCQVVCSTIWRFRGNNRLAMGSLGFQTAPSSSRAHMGGPSEWVARVAIECVHLKWNEPSHQEQGENHPPGRFESRSWGVAEEGSRRILRLVRSSSQQHCLENEHGAVCIKINAV